MISVPRKNSSRGFGHLVCILKAHMTRDELEAARADIKNKEIYIDGTDATYWRVWGTEPFVILVTCGGVSREQLSSFIPGAE